MTRRDIFTLFSFMGNWDTTFFIFLLILQTVQEIQGGRYKEKCSKNQDCKETGFCDQISGLCTCVDIPNKLKQTFDSNTRVCLSAIGSICTIDTSPSKADFLCVPNASCRPQVNLVRTLGTCQCVANYVQTSDFSCGVGGGQVASKSVINDKPRQQGINAKSYSSSTKINIHQCCWVFTAMVFTWLL